MAYAPCGIPYRNENEQMIAISSYMDELYKLIVKGARFFLKVCISYE
jgi:hypothetical protein